MALPVAALLLALLAVAARATDQQPTPQQIAACRGDAFKFCASSIGDNAALRACMIAHKAQLSQACRSAMQ